MQAICAASAQREIDEKILSRRRSCISPAFPFDEDQPMNQTLNLDTELESNPYGRSTCRSNYMSGRSKLAAQIFCMSILSIIFVACVCNYPLLHVQPAHANHKSTFDLQLRAMHSQAWRARERDELLRRVASSLQFQPFTLASEYSREKQKHLDRSKVIARRTRETVESKQRSLPSNAVAALDDPSGTSYTSHISALETAARFQNLMQSPGLKAVQHPSRKFRAGVDPMLALPTPHPVSSWFATPTPSPVVRTPSASSETGRGIMFWISADDREGGLPTTETANATEPTTTSEEETTSDYEKAYNIAKNPAVAYMAEWKLEQFSA
jgi:hypothetical protein